MHDDALTLEEALSYAITVLRGIHAEARAARLEQRALLGTLSESDSEQLRLSLCVADEVADVLDGEDEPEARPDARFMS